MYGQYQNPGTSAAKWIFFGFFGIILMGFLLGTNFKDATWFNPAIADAKADRIRIESAHQQATYELQERLVAAQTDADIREIQRQQALVDARFQHEIQLLNQDILHKELAFRTWITVLQMFAIAVALTLSLSTVIWVGSRAHVYAKSVLQKGENKMKGIPPVEMKIPNLTEREPYDPWHKEEYRRAKIKEARYRERKSRKADLGKDKDKMPIAK